MVGPFDLSSSRVIMFSVLIHNFGCHRQQTFNNFKSTFLIWAFHVQWGFSVRQSQIANCGTQAERYHHAHASLKMTTQCTVSIGLPAQSFHPFQFGCLLRIWSRRGDASGGMQVSGCCHHLLTQLWKKNAVVFERNSLAHGTKPDSWKCRCNLGIP